MLANLTNRRYKRQFLLSEAYAVAEEVQKDRKKDDHKRNEDAKTLPQRDV